MNVFLCLYIDKNGIEVIFTQKLLVNFTNDYNETASNTFELNVLSIKPKVFPFKMFYLQFWKIILCSVHGMVFRPVMDSCLYWCLIIFFIFMVLVYSSGRNELFSHIYGIVACCVRSFPHTHLKRARTNSRVNFARILNWAFLCFFWAWINSDKTT